MNSEFDLLQFLIGAILGLSTFWGLVFSYEHYKTKKENRKWYGK